MPSTVADALAIDPLGVASGIRAFARRADQLLDGTEVLDRAWQRAVAEAQGAGVALSDIVPDFEAMAVRWRAFVEDVRDFGREAIDAFRATTRHAVEYLDQLIREFNEWLGFADMWSELREWILRELRAFRGGRTISERIDNVERSAGATLAIVAVAALAGIGLWGWWEWRKRAEPIEAFEAAARGARR